jgi:hypothetical protein
LHFDRYLLLDPPVRLIGGMERLDAFHDVPLALPEAEREAEVRQERQDLGVLLTERRALRRHPPYAEIGDYSFSMYFYAFLLPYYRDRMGSIDSAEQMVAVNDLHAIAEPLRGNPKLRVFANRNDFLTSDEDVTWLTALVGPERARFFPTGGHLGNLHKPEVQAEVMSSLEDLVTATSPP